jgi:integrase
MFRFHIGLFPIESKRITMPRKKKPTSIRGFGSVYQRGSDKRWVAKYKAEGTKSGYKEEYAHTDEEAYAKLERAWLEHQQGILATGPNQKLGDYLEQWLEDVHKPTIGLSTYVKYRSVLNNHIKPLLGNRQIKQVTPQHIQTFYANLLKNELSPSTVQIIHAFLHKAFDNAVMWNLIARNVCDRVTPPRMTKKEMPSLNLEQAHMLLEAAREHQLETLLILVVVTGMRHGELRGLRWQDINFVEKSLQVKRTSGYLPGYGYVEREPKSAKGKRKIILPDFVIEQLKKHRMQQVEVKRKASNQWQDKDLVFCNRTGGFIHESNVMRMYRMILAKAGLPLELRMHDLRHSAATILLSMGIHPKIVQELLGHSDIGMTMNTYSHVLPSMQQEAMDKWDAVFSRGEHTLSHEAEQPCEICARYGIALPRMLYGAVVYINGISEKLTVQDISIHHPLELQAQRHLDATGYAEIGQDLLMVRTTFCTGVLAWEPI